MFTGIIEDLGTVVRLEKEQSNLHITVQSKFTSELKIDQSVAHNGTCLTVIKIDGDEYTVTAIDETLQKTNLNQLLVGDHVNLERCAKLGDRLDGHIVQGHVDLVGEVEKIVELDGSTEFYFKYDSDKKEYQTVEKGSVCINGVSLTVINAERNSFNVAIIPFTIEHTNFSDFKVGTKVNLEFDIIGKYVAKMFQK